MRTPGLAQCRAAVLCHCVPMLWVGKLRQVARRGSPRALLLPCAPLQRHGQRQDGLLHPVPHPSLARSEPQPLACPALFLAAWHPKTEQLGGTWGWGHPKAPRRLQETSHIRGWHWASWVCAGMHVCACKYVKARASVHLCVSMCECACMCMCKCACMCMRVCT